MPRSWSTRTNPGNRLARTIGVQLPSSQSRIQIEESDDVSGRTYRMTNKDDYYVYRAGATRPQIGRQDLERLLVSLFRKLEDEGWYQASLGLDCVDAPLDIGAVVLADLGYDLWPLSANMKEQSQEWLFTAIEFSYRHVAKPTETTWHSWNQCGVHVINASSQAGKQQFQEQVNKLLARYSPPYWIADDGLIYEVPPTGMEDLQPTTTGEASIDGRVASALRSFHRYGASEDDKRHAVKDLADILENLRATVGTGLPKDDENDLFILANKFAIRHYRPDQKTDYDTGIWLDWMFYAFLNSIHLICRLRQLDLP